VTGKIRTAVDDDVVRSRMGGPRLPVSHGRWSLEVRGDEIAEIRFDGVHLLRAVRPVVRDRDWNTVPVTAVAHELLDGGSTVVARLRFEADGIAYEATVALRLREDELSVDFDGRALVGFERNRIGLVVLHPAAEAGRAVEVIHTDGRVTATSWPTDISAHQPFRDVAGFAWTRDGVTATVTLAGEVFETEDQRNWTDASFKTYGTPLSIPFPVAVPAGATCHQTLRITATGHASRSSVDSDGDRLTIASEVAGSMPSISVGAGLYPPPNRVPELPAAFETVLVELTGDHARWAASLGSAALQADAAGGGLDVRIVTAEEGAVERCVADLVGLPVVRLGVFDPHRHISTPGLWRALREGVRRHGLRVELVGGTRAHFTELNRQIHDIPTDVPALSFGITPQMHATEVPHIVDSLGVQRTVAENALRLAQGRPVFVGPVTLARRFNAVATTAAPDPAVEAQRAVDPLQGTGFTAAWTVGSVASLAPTGVAGLCYFELFGPRGIVSLDGTPTPAGRVLVELARLRGRPVLRCAGPVDVPSLAVTTADGGAIELFVANLTATPRTVTVIGPGQGRRTVHLDGWSVRRTALSTAAR
jgi:D-apionolactonase